MSEYVIENVTIWVRKRATSNNTWVVLPRWCRSESV